MADARMGAKKSRMDGFQGVLVHGSRKFQIDLPSLECTLRDLTDVAYELTQVPSSRQRLIYKGRSLTHIDHSLLENGLQNGAKIMLIGRRNDPVEENLMKSIDQVAKEVEDTDRKFRETESEFISFQQGYLSKKQLAESITSLGKNLKRDDERLMKCIENLDCMEIDGAYQDAKTRKRNLIKKIQNLHDVIDAFESKLEEYKVDNHIQ